MIGANDLALLSVIHLKALKSLSVGDLMRFKKAGVTTVEGLLLQIGGYDVASCIYSNVKLDTGLGIDAVFSALTRCWINGILGICKAVMASEKVTSFIRTYITKYLITYLVRSIRYIQGAAVGKPVTILGCLEDIDGINSVSKLYEMLRLCEDVNRKVLTDVLHWYREIKLADLNVSMLEMELTNSYWRHLIACGRLLQPQHNLLRVLRLLNEFRVVDMLIKKRLAMGEGVEDVMRKYDYSVFRDLVKPSLGNAMTYDITSSFLAYRYASSLLKYSPLSYDALLRYLVLKEWESMVISFIIYGLSHNLGTYLLEALSVWTNSHVPYEAR